MLRLALVALVLAPTLAHAEEPPPTAVPTGTGGGQKPASSGTTEIEGQGKFGSVTAVDDENKDVTELNLSAGGMLSTGNSRTAAGTLSTNFRLRRKVHQFTAIVLGNYGAAAPSPAADKFETTVANIQGRTRYDAFLSERWSAFAMLTARHDRFQGLDFRLNVDPGIAYYIIPKKNHRLWLEIGYDYQFDLRRDDAIIEKDDMGNPVLDADGNTIQIADKTFQNHAVRLFAGYSNHLSEKVTFDTGVEYMQSVVYGDVFRINWDNALTTQLANRFSLSATFTLRYENHPLPDVRKLDTITAMNVVYRFF
ncbi:MAG: DUF481 domain-containing protein [Nannocystaceae bacterium]